MFGLTDKEIQGLRQIFTSVPEVKEVILYGSRARGDYKPYSDVDITLIGDSLQINHLSQIEQAIDDLYMPYFVDLSLKKNLTNPALLHNIERDGARII